MEDDKKNCKLGPNFKVTDELNPKGKMTDAQFDLPKNFFDDTILLPDFYMPENHDLEIVTSNTIRKTLFNEAYHQVKIIEYAHMHNEKDYFKFQNIEKTQPNLLDNLIKMYRKRFKLWRYVRNGKEVFYKAIFLHDLKNERFYGYVSPKAPYDKVLNWYYRVTDKY